MLASALLTLPLPAVAATLPSYPSLMLLHIPKSQITEVTLWFVLVPEFSNEYSEPGL